MSGGNVSTTDSEKWRVASQHAWKHYVALSVEVFPNEMLKDPTSDKRQNEKQEAATAASLFSRGWLGHYNTRKA